MSEKSKIKEELSWNRTTFVILAAIDASLLAWFAQNYETTNIFMFIVCFIAIVIASYGIIFINIYAFKCFNKLEKL